MSDALQYLLKARPEAMGAYFKFLKEAGRRLDPKTRAIISVITKVGAQTDDGFRQYLTRALREGVTPDEILDGLLTAFPILGLSKIVWAVDILLEMDIPEFRVELLGAEAEWHDIVDVAAIGDGAIARVACDGRELFVCRQADEFSVYDSRCPHQVTNIPELALDGNVLVCPKHAWKFNINTGECIEKGDRPLKAFKSRIGNGRLLAFW